MSKAFTSACLPRVTQRHGDMGPGATLRLGLTDLLGHAPTAYHEPITETVRRGSKLQIDLLVLVNANDRQPSRLEDDSRT